MIRTFILTFFLSIATSMMAQKTYVVAVGLSDYLHPEIAPLLPNSRNDVRDIAKFFHGYNGASVFMLLDKNATRKHILKVLRQEFSKSTTEDEIIFVFSGHGVQGGLSVYEISSMDDVITYNEIQSIMKGAKAHRKIILANACYSGGLNASPRRNGGNNGSTKVEKTSVMLYTSSRASEVSYGSGMLRNSFFIRSILRAFEGRADRNGDNKITARELFNYVNQEVETETEDMQHPQMWGRFSDDMVVVNVK